MDLLGRVVALGSLVHKVRALTLLTDDLLGHLDLLLAGRGAAAPVFDFLLALSVHGLER